MRATPQRDEEEPRGGVQTLANLLALRWLRRHRHDYQGMGNQALATVLKQIRPDLEVHARRANLLSSQLTSDGRTEDADLVIDTAAAHSVLKKLELRCHSESGLPIPVASLVIGPRAERGLVVLAKKGHSGGPVDVLRRAKLDLQSRSDLAAYRDVFWPDPEACRTSMLQPEPGCSSPTFVGSAADVAALAGMMLNSVAVDLLAATETATAVARFVAQPQTRTGDQPSHARLCWGPDRVVQDRRGRYEVRVSESAWNEMRRWIAKGHQRRGRDVETGGLLLGERDGAAKTIWVSEVSGPPPDSQFSKNGFVCGTIGTAELCRRRKQETARTVQFIGMWHTHSTGPAEPSSVDVNGMARVVSNLDASIWDPLLLIVGNAASDPELGVHVFVSDDGAEERGIPVSRVRGMRAIRYGIISIVYVGQSRVRSTISGWYEDISETIRRLVGRRSV